MNNAPLPIYRARPAELRRVRFIPRGKPPTPRACLLILAAALALLPAHAAHAQAATPAPVQVTTGADGTQAVQTALALTPGQTFTVDNTGKPVPITIPTVLAARGGTSTATTAALTRAIVFSSPMPSAGYAITAIGSSGIGALQLTYSNKTVNGFTLNFSLSTSASVDWTATQNQ